MRMWKGIIYKSGFSHKLTQTYTSLHAFFFLSHYTSNFKVFLLLNRKHLRHSKKCVLLKNHIAIWWVGL